MSNIIGSEKMIDIGKEFSLYPMGRTAEDGDGNGQSFFTNFLLPQIKNGLRVVVDFDSARTFGSSFLDEAFHIMPEENGFNRHQFSSLVKVKATTKAALFYKDMAERFMKRIG